MSKLQAKDSVKFTPAVCRMLSWSSSAKLVRGEILEIVGAVATVDFKGTWNSSVDGNPIRSVPLANLTRV